MDMSIKLVDTRDIGPTVAIVGAGASGTLLASHLVRSGPVRVVLIERGDRVGRGVAYGTEVPAHLLNVPAASLSGLPDDPEHFLRFVRRTHDAGGGADDVRPPARLRRLPRRAARRERGRGLPGRCAGAPSGRGRRDRRLARGLPAAARRRLDPARRPRRARARQPAAARPGARRGRLARGSRALRERSLAPRRARRHRARPGAARSARA